MPIISLVNQKGGVGKSTLSTIVTAGLLHHGYTVALIDADPQRNAFTWASAAKENAGEETAVPHAEHICRKQISDDIARLSSEYDYIVIDTAANYTENNAFIIGGIVMRSDLILVPVKPGYYELSTLTQTLETIDLVWNMKATNTTPPVHLVVNMLQPNTNVGQDTLAVLDQAPYPLLRTRIHDRQIYKKFNHEGFSPFALRPGHEAHTEVTGLMNDILSITSTAAEAS